MEASQAVVFETASDIYEGMIAAAEVFDRASIEREAWILINGRETRPAAEVPFREYQDNARTALMEALTASGHLSRVEISGSLEDINHQILTRLLNGWSDSLPIHEKQRRFAELCNELAIQKVQQMIADGGLPQSAAVTEISDYPLSLDDRTATSLGYRASNRKGMIRSTHLQKNPDGSFSRIIEQVSRANGTPASSYRFFKAAGIKADSAQPADLAILEAPFIYSADQYADGVIDIVRRLDGQSVAPVLYGDPQSKAARHAPYERLREESARRESEIDYFVDDLADLERQLAVMNAEGRLGHDEQMTIFKEEVERILSAICTNSPEYAEDTFGKKAALHFEEAARLYASGDGLGAQQQLEAADYLKETVTFCGMSISVEEAQKEGLKVSGFSQLMEKARENWKWKKGVCLVSECPTRPSKTEVGPCSVCRKCQKIFDKGNNPKAVYGTINFLDWLFGIKR